MNQHRKRIYNQQALRRDPSLLAFANRGPEDGSFLDRRKSRRKIKK